jgi:LmbE family N-acetylglucosaminyl deacetylase
MFLEPYGDGAAVGLDHLVVGRRQALQLGGWLGVTGVAPHFAAPSSRPDREVIFYSPHPDDETLSMSVLIASHVLAGRAVHVVLLSDGRTSNAYPLVNARLVAEHRTPLTRAQFGAARVRELRAAVAAMGVPAADVHLETVPDAMTVADLTPVIQRYRARYPAAGHYTMSWTDTFAPHAHLGEALRRLAVAHPHDYPDTRWAVSRLHWHEPAVRALKPWSTTGSAKARSRVRSAAAAYGVWAPGRGRYRIGYTSVQPQFRALVADPRCLVHGPPSGS